MLKRMTLLNKDGNTLCKTESKDMFELDLQAIQKRYPEATLLEVDVLVDGCWTAAAVVYLQKN
jgi:hypothetical protein